MSTSGRYDFPPRSTRGVILGITLGQVVAMAAVGAPAVLFVMATQLLLPALVVVALVAAGVFLRIGNSTLLEWSVPGAQHLWEMARGRATWGRSLAAPTILPPELAGLVIRLHDKVGLVELKGGGFAGVLRVSGTEFPLLDEGEQNRRIAAWAEVLSTLTRPGLRLQIVERAVPDAGLDQSRYMAAELDPDGPATKDYLDMVAGAESVSVRHESFVVLAATPSVRHRRGTSMLEQRMAAVVAEIGLFADRLAGADLDVSKPLNDGEIALVLRQAIDPPFLDVGAGRALAGGDPEPAPDNFGPMARRKQWGTYRTENVFHATYRVAEFPRLPVGSDWMAPLVQLRTSGIRTLAIFLEPLTPAKAASRVRRTVVAYRGDEEHRRRHGFSTSARQRRESQAADEREEEMVSGHALVPFCALVSVTAASEGDLAVACRDVEQAGIQSHLDLRREWGRQAEAFVATLPAYRLEMPTWWR